MYLRRKIDKFLDDWKRNPNRKPLLVNGARQVGKSESIRHFGQKYYDNIIEINFVSQPAFKAITQEGFETDKLIRNISLLSPESKITPGKTLIFFDEIQDYPEIATSLKFFKIDGRFDVICSGSMLGIHYKRIHSISVGYKTDYEMYSIDFEEFLWAKGYQDAIIDDMYRHIVNKEPFSTLEHDLYVSLFRDFCVLGGMPEIVAAYISSGTFEGYSPCSVNCSLTIATMCVNMLRDRPDPYTECIKPYSGATWSGQQEIPDFKSGKRCKGERLLGLRGMVGRGRNNKYLLLSEFPGTAT